MNITRKSDTVQNSKQQQKMDSPDPWIDKTQNEGTFFNWKLNFTLRYDWSNTNPEDLGKPAYVCNSAAYSKNNDQEIWFKFK